MARHLFPLAESHGLDYGGRRQRLLFDPTTHRLQGTTSTFFATMGIMPAGNVDIPHRHTSAAINYNFQGRGRALTEQEQIARLSTLAVAGHERR